MLKLIPQVSMVTYEVTMLSNCWRGSPPLTLSAPGHIPESQGPVSTSPPHQLERNLMVTAGNQGETSNKLRQGSASQQQPVSAQIGGA